MVNRCIAGILLALITSCSAKAGQSGGEATPPMPEVNLPPEAAKANVPPPDPREAALAAVVLKLIEREHLLHATIDDKISREAFETFIERLDPGKMFLVETDKQMLSKYADKIDDQLHSGSLDLAHDGAKVYAARVAMVEKIVTEALAKPMNHDDEETVELDPKKLQLALNEQELGERWRKRLELEVLERVVGMEARLKAEADKANKSPKAPPDPKKAPPKPDADADDDVDDKATPIAQIPTTPAAREQKAREDIAKTYSGRFARLKNPGKLDAAADLVNAVVSTLDPHTTYLPPADKANFDIQMSGSLEGIGAVLREKEHYIEIVEIVPGGASSRNGHLAQGDIILSVAPDNKDAVDTFDMRIDEVVKMIRGKKGTQVRLRIQKPTGTEETVTITRDVVVIEDSYAKGATVQKNGQTFGYIYLPSFYGGQGAPRGAASDVHRLLGEMKKAKVAGVILDIRGNGGGLLGDAVTMTGEFVDQGPVVQVQDGHQSKDILSDERPGIDTDRPVIVMVDKFSASASEIVAGALQDYGRAIIVGTSPTHGKGTVQTLADLDRATNNQVELGVLKLTIQQFFRVNGASTQREGVTPDILLPDPAAHIDSGERTLDHAIAWSSIDPAQYTKWNPTWKATAKLGAMSAARVAKNPQLAKVAAATAVLKVRREQTLVPLAKVAYEKRRDDQKAALDAASLDFKKAPAAFTVKLIEDPAAGTPPPPMPGQKPDDRAKRWSDNLARDPWVDETLNILADMTKP